VKFADDTYLIIPVSQQYVDGRAIRSIVSVLLALHMHIA